MAIIKRFLYDLWRCLRVLVKDDKQYIFPYSKRRISVFIDQLKWLVRNGEYCEMYNAWGINGGKHQIGDYLSKNEFNRIKKKAEKVMKAINGHTSLDYQVLTKDKYICSCFLSSNGFPIIPVKGMFIRGDFVSSTDNDLSFEGLLSCCSELFVKNVSLEASEGVLYCQLSKGSLLVNRIPQEFTALYKKLEQGVWIIQERVESHQSIRQLNDTALNTTRIYTIMINGTAMYAGGFQALAAKGGFTDSWDKGAIYIGIDIEKEALGRYGFHNLTESGYGVSEYDPVSKISFYDYPVPYLKHAVEICIDAHKFLYNNFVLGWDVAITDTGPVIVEVNENPGISVLQCMNSDFRRQITMSVEQLLRWKR